MPNNELLTKTMKAVEHEAKPYQWDQEVWALVTVPEDTQPAGDGTNNREMDMPLTVKCLTSGCFAGWAVVIDGRSRVRSTRMSWPFASAYVTDLHAEPELGWPDECLSARAQRLLGLDDEDRVTLFLPVNTLSDLTRMVDNIIAGRAADDDF